MEALEQLGAIAAEGLWKTGLLVLPSHLDLKALARDKKEDLGILKISIWTFLHLIFRQEVVKR